MAQRRRGKGEGVDSHEGDGPQATGEAIVLERDADDTLGARQHTETEERKEQVYADSLRGPAEERTGQ